MYNKNYSLKTLQKKMSVPNNQIYSIVSIVDSQIPDNYLVDATNEQPLQNQSDKQNEQIKVQQKLLSKQQQQIPVPNTLQHPKQPVQAQHVIVNKKDDSTISKQKQLIPQLNLVGQVLYKVLDIQQNEQPQDQAEQQAKNQIKINMNKINDNQIQQQNIPQSEPANKSLKETEQQVAISQQQKQRHEQQQKVQQKNKQEDNNSTVKDTKQHKNQDEVNKLRDQIKPQGNKNQKQQQKQQQEELVDDMKPKRHKNFQELPPLEEILNPEEHLFHLNKHAYLSYQKGQFIMKEVLNLIENQNLLDYQNQQHVEFLFLVAVRVMNYFKAAYQGYMELKNKFKNSKSNSEKKKGSHSDDNEKSYSEKKLKKQEQQDDEKQKIDSILQEELPTIYAYLLKSKSKFKIYNQTLQTLRKKLSLKISKLFNISKNTANKQKFLDGFEGLDYSIEEQIEFTHCNYIEIVLNSKQIKSQFFKGFRIKKVLRGYRKICMIQASEIVGPASWTEQVKNIIVDQ